MNVQKNQVPFHPGLFALPLMVMVMVMVLPWPCLRYKNPRYPPILCTSTPTAFRPRATSPQIPKSRMCTSSEPVRRPVQVVLSRCRHWTNMHLKAPKTNGVKTRHQRPLVDSNRRPSNFSNDRWFTCWIYERDTQRYTRVIYPITIAHSLSRNDIFTQDVKY